MTVVIEQNMAAVTEQKLKSLIENWLVSYREVEFTETSLLAYPWYEYKVIV